MINVLIPSMGKSLFFKDVYFPKPMIEICGKTMLEYVIENYSDLASKHYVFVFDHKDCVEFHIDDSARILTEPDTDIIVLENQTGGALCTCLMAIKQINNSNPLIIANCDQIISVDYNRVIERFVNSNCSAGVITFDNIHPRWSYVRIVDNEVIEVAEKRPISNNAIAGFYYFEHGSDFVECAKRVIMKDCDLNGSFYISTSLNEMILMGKKIGYYQIDRSDYHSFYSPEKIKDYETLVGARNENK